MKPVIVRLLSDILNLKVLSSFILALSMNVEVRDYRSVTKISLLTRQCGIVIEQNLEGFKIGLLSNTFASDILWYLIFFSEGLSILFCMRPENKRTGKTCFQTK